MITKKTFAAAKKLIRDEKNWDHKNFSGWKEGQNCYCVLGAIGQAAGEKYISNRSGIRGVRGFAVLYDLEKLCYGRVNRLLNRLGDPKSTITHKESLVALDTLARNFKGGK